MLNIWVAHCVGWVVRSFGRAARLPDWFSRGHREVASPKTISRDRILTTLNAYFNY